MFQPLQGHVQVQVKYRISINTLPKLSNSAKYC